MSGQPENGTGKPSFFGKMYNFVKTVAERAMDPDAIPSDDENDGNKSDDEEEDMENITVDFRQKYAPGKTVLVTLDQEEILDTIPALSVDGAIDDLNLDAFNIDPSEIETELEKEVITSAEVRESADDGSPHGFVGRSTGTTFFTRVGPNYKTNKLKAASAPALMELMSADFVRTPCRVPDIGRYLDIPAEWKGLDTHHPAVPPLFIVQAQIPNKWPTTVFVETTDGPCYSFIMVFRLTQATVDALADLEHAPPAVQLFAQYCAECREEGDSASTAVDSPGVTETAAEPAAANMKGGDVSSGSGSGNSGTSKEWIGRTKVFVRCDNLNELKLPKFLHTYNAKPALIRESGTLVRGEGYLELDVNIKKFGLLANKTLPMLLARLHLMDLHIGLCVESREEAELPEGMLGCVRVHKLSAKTDRVPLWFVRKAATTA